MKYGGSVYISTNFHHTVLYTGVTSDLPGRKQQHKTKESRNSFTARYNCGILVWYEWFSRIEAIARENQIKAGNRKKKEDLIHSMNPHWNDLWEEVKKW